MLLFNFLHRGKILNCLMMIGNLYDTIIKATIENYGCIDLSNNSC